MSSSTFHSDDAFRPARDQAIGKAFVMHLNLIGHLSEAEQQALLSLGGKVCDIERGTDLLHTGNKPTNVVVVLKGMLQRYTLGALAPSTVALVPPADLLRLMELHPSLTGLFWRQTLVQASIFREWLMRNSQKVAPAQMAHLFCEMFTRSRGASEIVRSLARPGKAL